MAPGLPTARSATTTTTQHDFALLFVAALTLVTAVVLLRIEALLAVPVLGGDTAAANEAVVRRYYDAANAAIATGEIEAVVALVAPNLVLPPERSEPAVGREALLARLLALHAADPTLRIVVRDIVADEDDVVARVAIEGAVSGLPPAMQFSRFDADWLDGFRVQHASIVAAWGATTGLSAPHLLLATEISEAHSPEPVIALTRLTLAPGAFAPVMVGFGPLVIVPEETSLQVRVAGTGRLTRTVAGTVAETTPTRVMTEATGPIDVRPGNQVAIDAGVAFTLHNLENTPAGALIMAAYPSTTFDPVSFTNAGVEPQALSVAIFEPMPREYVDEAALVWEPLVREMVVVPSGWRYLWVEQVVVEPGGVIPTFSPLGDMLIVVTQGTLVADVAREARHEQRTPITLAAHAGSTVLLQDRAVTLRNVGDVAAVLLTITLAPIPPPPTASATPRPGPDLRAEDPAALLVA